MAQKNIYGSIKNHNKKHHREILRGALSFYISMIFSSCFSLKNFGPSRQIRISRSENYGKSLQNTFLNIRR